MHAVTEGMSRQGRWICLAVEHGVATYRLLTWNAFPEFLDVQVFKNRGRAEHRFIWRGQRRADWKLSSSLDRLFERLNYAGVPGKTLEQRSQEHLDDFKYAARGRRGISPLPLLENEWWALGQHFGLATPLLDWSRSPFAAAYFAFEGHEPGTDHRMVYGLDVDAVAVRNKVALEEESTEGRPSVLELVDPLSDDNLRLVSQGALFTRAPIGTAVEEWIQAAFAGSEMPVLLRMELPDVDRSECLRALERMNINHLSLFPDLTGASRATNLKTEIDLLL